MEHDGYRGPSDADNDGGEGKRRLPGFPGAPGFIAAPETPAALSDPAPTGQSAGPGPSGHGPGEMTVPAGPGATPGVPGPGRPGAGVQGTGGTPGGGPGRPGTAGVRGGGEIPGAIGIPGAAGAPGGPLFLTVVLGSSGVNAAVRVAADRPARELVAYLAGSVGIEATDVQALLRQDGFPLTPERPLGLQGVHNGSSIQVIPVGDAPPGPPAAGRAFTEFSEPGPGFPQPELPPTEIPSAETAAPAGPPPDGRSGRWAGAPLAPLSLPPLLRSEPMPSGARAPRSGSAGSGSNGLRTGVVAGVAVIVGVGLFALGGVIFHNSSSSGSSAKVSPVATEAAQAWLHASPYTGPAVAGLPANLSRQGSIAGSLEPVSSWHNSTSSGAVFIVTATGAQPFALTVTLSGNKLSLPPIVTGLPFASSAVPPAPGRTNPTPSGTPAAVSTWVGDMFGTASAPGSWTTTLGIGAIGTPKVVGAWTPKAGGTVYRTQVDLASSAPGTATAQATTNAQAVSSAQAAAHNALGTLNSAKSADASAHKKLADDQAAANPPAPAPTTPPPGAPPAPPTPAAPPSAAQKAAAAAIGPDTTAVRQADTTLASAQKAYVQAQAAVQAAMSAQSSGPKATSPVSAVGTYDIWISTSDTVAGWSPAGYALP